MSESQLVSVITPTWQRHEVLLDRCIPSVQRRQGVALEHIVVSDGPDPDLNVLIPEDVCYFELPEHDPALHWGAPARNFGVARGKGEFIAYLDDDDEWEPLHLA